MNIREIAALAGVSPGTVSKIINKKDKDISDETRERVLAVIKQYHYQPYSKVLRRAGTKSGILGVVVPCATGAYSALLDGLGRAATAGGYALLLCCAESPQAVEKQLALLESKNAEGAVLFLPAGAAWPEGLESGFPLVLAGHSRVKRGPTSCHCGFDDGARLAAEHLLAQNHSQIAFIGLETPASERASMLEGLSQAMYRHDLLLQESHIFTAETEAGAAAKGAGGLVGTNVTAILCQTGATAAHTVRELARYGVQVPADMSVISIGPAPFLSPEITYVDLPLREMGEWAAAELIRQLEKQEHTRPDSITLPPALVRRASVGLPSLQRRRGQRIVVVGSMNMDITVRVPRIPTGGETVLASGTALIPGGKGGNQAVGAGRLGGDVHIIGRLGSDNEGKAIYSSLAADNVKLDGVVFDQNDATGKAYIHVAPDGESTIVVYPGTNRKLEPAHIDEHLHLFENAGFCLVTTEIPWETVEHTVRVCSERGVRVILKPSTYDRLPAELLRGVSYFVPNEKEIHLQRPGGESMEEKAAHFVREGVENVIVTLGANGCYLCNREVKRRFPAADFTPVDTTGAADCFIAALAVYLGEGHSLTSSIKFATTCAGLSTTREGVQPSLPDRMALEMYTDHIKSHWPEGR